jgi:hypothetical protein
MISGISLDINMPRSPMLWETVISSLISIEKSHGLNMYPCLTPDSLEKKSVTLDPTLIHLCTL